MNHHALRRQLTRMLIGDCLRHGDHVIHRSVTRFQVQRMGEASMAEFPPPKNGIITTAYSFQRAVSMVIARLYGVEAAPELAHKHMTFDTRFRVWTTREGSFRPVASGDTPEEALADFAAWKAHSRNLWHLPRRVHKAALKVKL